MPQNLITHGFEARKMTFHFVQSNLNCSKPKGHFNFKYRLRNMQPCCTTGRECGVNLGKAEFPQGEFISPEDVKCRRVEPTKSAESKKQATTKSLPVFWWGKVDSNHRSR